MKYKDVEIGVPTLEQVRDFVDKKKWEVTAEMIYTHYERQGFKTRKGEPIKSVEGMCNGFNGAYLVKKYGKLHKKMKNAISIVAEEKPITHNRLMTYSEQIKDKRWLAFRSFVMQVRGYRCEVCGSNINLNVHHLIYKDGYLAWEYNTREVMVVCSECHKQIHEKDRAQPYPATPFDNISSFP